MTRVSRSLPRSWKIFCELESGSDRLWCFDQLPHVLSRLESFNLEYEWLENSGTAREQSYDFFEVNTDGECVTVWLQKLGWLLNVYQKLYGWFWSRNTWGKWSFNARIKLTSFVFLCLQFLDSWNFCRGSRLFFLKISDTSFSKFPNSSQWPMEFYL